MTLRIVQVEDDPDQAAVLTRWLSAEGHECRQAATVSELLELVTQAPADMILLDWNLPDASGEEAMARLQARSADCPPVMFVTAHDDEADLTRVLEAGAVDFLAKPVDRDALVARLAAYDPSPASAGGTEPYEFDRAAGVVSRDGVPVALDPVEFALADCLFENAGRLVSKAALGEIARRGGESRPAESRLSRIRAKLGLSPARGWQLRTVLRYGYRLEAVNRRR